MRMPGKCEGPELGWESNSPGLKSGRKVCSVPSGAEIDESVSSKKERSHTGMLKGGRKEESPE